MINALRFQLKYFLQIYLGIYFGGFVYGLFMYVIAGTDALGTLVGAFIAISLLAPIISKNTVSSIYFSLAVSYGVTRKTFFYSLQIIKLLFSLIQSIIIFTVVVIITKGEILLISLSILIFLLNFILASLGELLGILTLRFSKVVTIISIIILTSSVFAIGIWFGFISVKYDNSILDVLMNDLLLNNYSNNLLMLNGVLIIICLMLTSASKILCSKISINH